jgi:Lrp/AsnC family transcriptional regulator, regulator for asnA, asnC and gidA
MSKIDKIDYQIINLLVADGRASAADIARQLENVTERTVRYRIERLLRDDLIQICAVPNPRMLGFSVTADVFIEVEADLIFDVARKLAEFDCISYVACSIGEMDVSAQILAGSTDEVYAFITEVIRKIPGVRKTATSIVPLVLKDIHNWRIPESTCAEEA